MKAAKWFMGLGALLMAVLIVYGLMNADFFAQGSAITSLYWGKVTLVDIYLSFLVFFCWVLYRETSWSLILFWLVGILITGSLAICLYTFIALVRSDGDWKRFWHGKRTSL